MGCLRQPEREGEREMFGKGSAATKGEREWKEVERWETRRLQMLDTPTLRTTFFVAICRCLPRCVDSLDAHCYHGCWSKKRSQREMQIRCVNKRGTNTTTCANVACPVPSAIEKTFPLHPTNTSSLVLRNKNLHAVVTMSLRIAGQWNSLQKRRVARWLVPKNRTAERRVNAARFKLYRLEPLNSPHFNSNNNDNNFGGMMCWETWACVPTIKSSKWSTKEKKNTYRNNYARLGRETLLKLLDYKKKLGCTIYIDLEPFWKVQCPFETPT